MSEPVEGLIDDEPTTATCCECDEPIPERCLRHEALHLLKTRGREWLLKKAVEWMAESEQKKGS